MFVVKVLLGKILGIGLVIVKIIGCLFICWIYLGFKIFGVEILIKILVFLRVVVKLLVWCFWLVSFVIFVWCGGRVVFVLFRIFVWLIMIICFILVDKNFFVIERLVELLLLIIIWMFFIFLLINFKLLYKVVRIIIVVLCWLLWKMGIFSLLIKCCLILK